MSDFLSFRLSLVDKCLLKGKNSSLLERTCACIIISDDPSTPAHPSTEILGSLHWWHIWFLDLRVTYVCKEGEIGATVYLVPGLRANWASEACGSQRRGGGQGGKSPFSLLSEPISPSSLNGYVSFSPSSQLFWGHFFLLPILFLPPLREDKGVQGGHTAGGQKIARDYKLSVKQNFTVRVTQQPGTS